MVRDCHTDGVETAKDLHVVPRSDVPHVGCGPRPGSGLLWLVGWVVIDSQQKSWLKKSLRQKGKIAWL